MQQTLRNRGCGCRSRRCATQRYRVHSNGDRLEMLQYPIPDPARRLYARLAGKSCTFASISTRHPVARSRFQKAADTVRDASGCRRRAVHDRQKPGGRPPHQLCIWLGLSVALWVWPWICCGPSEVHGRVGEVYVEGYLRCIPFCIGTSSYPSPFRPTFEDLVPVFLHSDARGA